MSILCKTHLGVVVNHLSYTENIYKDCGSDNNGTSEPADYRLKSDFFNIHSPFMMDTQFEKLKEQSRGEESTVPRKRKKRKQLDANNVGKQDEAMFHKKIRDILQTSLDKLVILARELGHLLPCSEGYTDNNTAARQAAKSITGPGYSLMEMSNMACDNKVISDEIFCINHDTKEESSLFNRMVQYTDDHPCLQLVLGSFYLFPPHSSFLMSDLSLIKPLTTGKETHDMIVIDPPWQNKSVRRKQKYTMVEDDDLLNLPVPELARAGCLVVVWATSNQYQHRLIKDQMFPKWEVKLLAQWYWIKVTKHGVPVVDLDDPHKKPYETLFLGCTTEPMASKLSQNDSREIVDNENMLSSSSPSGSVCAAQPGTSWSKDHSTGLERKGNIAGENEESRNIPERLKNLPNDFVIVSVPSSLHSQKPPLIEVLRPYLPSSPDCLELFARSLLPNCTSWGNEVLKLQHVDFYEKL